ncbi:hypothetical protein ACQY0O_007376 [Thecaphora frezii]
MGKSAKFYKKPTLREKQSLVKSSTASPGSSSSKQRSSAFSSDAGKKAAAVVEGSKAARVHAQKAKERLEAEEAAKPKFGQLKVAPSSRGGAQNQGASDDDGDLEMEDDDEEVIKRRPRNRNRKDWGPMPKEMGIDYVKLWDNRSK